MLEQLRCTLAVSSTTLLRRRTSGGSTDEPITQLRAVEDKTHCPSHAGVVFLFPVYEVLRRILLPTPIASALLLMKEYNKKRDEHDAVSESFSAFFCFGSRAIAEYLRVLKPWGFLVSSPLMYHTQPPLEVVNDVSEIIGVQIEPMSKSNWVGTVMEATENFELYFQESHILSPKMDEEIEVYIDYFINKNHIKALPEDTREAIRGKWSKILKTFNENHKYLGYDIVIFRKRLIPEEPELFINR